MFEQDTDLANDADQSSNDSTDDIKVDDTDDDSSDDADDNDKPTDGTDDQDDDKADDADDVDDSDLEFPDWAKQEGLPEDISSVEDLAERFKTLQKDSGQEQLSPEMLRVDAMLKAQGIGGGVQDFLDGKSRLDSKSLPADDTPKGDAYFSQNQFGSYVDNALKNGTIKEEHAKDYRSMAQFNDVVFNEFIKKINDAFGSMAGVVQENRTSLGNISWGSVEKKVKGTGVTKEMLDSYMLRHGLTDYSKALPVYAMQENPGLFQQMQENARQKGINTGKKKLKRHSSIRRSKGVPQGVAGFDHKKYTNPDGTMSEAVREIIDLDEQSKVIDQYEKWEAKQHK